MYSLIPFSRQCLLLLPGLVSSFFTLAQRPSYSSEIQSISCMQLPVKIGGKDTSLYLNEMDFRLRDEDTVFVKDYGYLSGVRRIRFFSSNSGIVLKSSPAALDSTTISVQNRSVAQGTESLLDFPHDGEKPVDHTDFPVKDVKQFDEKLQTLINKYFLIGCQVSQQDQVFTKTTCYINLSVRDPNLTGQICLFISQPYLVNGQIYAHLSYKGREHRSSSPIWRDPGNDVDTAAKLFFEQFIRQL